MNIREESLQKHYEWNGKIEVVAKAKVNDSKALSLAYTPGVAEPCLEIQKNINKSYELTRRNNLVAVITDGSAVLGLGDIGPEAGMPVMEGKCVLFKEFGDVDAFPLCVKTKDVDEFVETVYNISGSFGGINLEDISAPRCFEIERKLIEKCDIPIFHDDQHGTAVVVSAALINATKIIGKDLSQCKAVINGARHRRRHGWLRPDRPRGGGVLLQDARVSRVRSASCASREFPSNEPPHRQCHRE